MFGFLKTISGRITTVVVFLIIFASAIGSVALYSLNQLTTGANEIISQNEDLVFVFRAQVKIAEMVRIEKELVILGTEAGEDHIAQHATLRADIIKDLQEVEGKLETDVERAKYGEIMDAVDSYEVGFAGIKAALEREAEATTPEEKAAAREEGINLSQTSSTVLAAEMNRLISEVVAGREEKVANVAESARDTSSTMQMLEIIILGFAILAGIVLAFWLVRSTNKALQAGINRMTTAADTLLQYTKDLTEQQNKLNTIVGQVASGSVEQSRQVEDNSKTMAELQKSLADTMESAKSAAETTASAAELASKGTEAGKEAMEKLKTIDEVVKENTEVVKDVDTKADEVTGIVVTTRDVADQINLLALNAAIEAARAGEAGRGFAVVADEVRKLAEQATQAVNKVDSVVKAMKESASGALRSLGEGSNRVAESTKIVQNALSILDQITAGAQEITSKAQDISAANVQQAQFAQKLVSALEAVATAAEQNTGASQQATASVKVVADYIKKTVNQSDKLTKLSQDMQALVGAVKGAKQAIEEAVAPEGPAEEAATPEEIAKIEEEEAKLAKEKEEMKKMAKELAETKKALEEAKAKEEAEEKKAAKKVKSVSGAKKPRKVAIETEKEEEEEE